MQFYIVHKDPVKNAKMLPTYALKVNMREGWQILSDIGHRFGVSWENQCKAYNPAHPWTRTFSHQQGFNRLIHGLEDCCNEYYNRTGKAPCWCGWVADFKAADKDETLFCSLPHDQEAETIHYLKNYKADKMTLKELEAL